MSGPTASIQATNAIVDNSAGIISIPSSGASLYLDGSQYIGCGSLSGLGSITLVTRSVVSLPAGCRSQMAVVSGQTSFFATQIYLGTGAVFNVTTRFNGGQIRGNGTVVLGAPNVVLLQSIIQVLDSTTLLIPAGTEVTPHPSFGVTLDAQGFPPGNCFRIKLHTIYRA